MKFRAAICLLVLFASVAALSQEQPKPQVVVIKAGKLIDPDNGTTATNQVIVVENGKIKSVGAGGEIPAGAQVIDLSSETVLPGLFDAHTHMALRTTKQMSYFTESIVHPTSYRTVEAVANAKEMLESGFTTIRDVGNDGLYAASALRWGVEQGIVPGPTVINAGRIIAPFGGQFHVQPQNWETIGQPEYCFADTRDEMRKCIRENIQFGATVIKIVVDDQKYIYTPDEIRFMINEAHSAGLKLAAHCWTHPGAHNAAEAGVDSIEHGYDMTDDDLALAKKNNVVLVGTDFTLEASREMGIKDPEKDHAHFLDRLKRAWKVGTPMAFGTDVTFNPKGGTRGTASVQFIDSFVEAGVPAPAIVKIMTANAARLLGVEKDRGFIKPGLWADIIATPANPFDDIQTLKKVNFVMKNGSVFRNDVSAK